MLEVAYVCHSGTDLLVANAARRSFDNQHTAWTETPRSRRGRSDAQLVSDLARDGHELPFRHPQITLACTAPLPVARQLGKHQVGFSWSEVSRRYKTGNLSLHTIEQWRAAPAEKRQGSGQPLDARTDALLTQAQPPKKPHQYQRLSRGFMGQQWDNGDAAHSVEFWAEVFRVLKPGGHVVAFSGTRTQHRQVCAIEDAGFEIRDQIGWLFGSGFPKSHNQKGEWEGWGSALKPAWEPICLARKPMIGTIAANLGRYGTGALWIDGCRIGLAQNEDAERLAARSGGHRGFRTAYVHGGKAGSNPAADLSKGRWPANILHDGSEEVLSAFPESDGAQGRVTGAEPSTEHRTILSGLAGRHAPREPRNDTGSAARFFYTAKADAEDRLGSKHPTVKPVDLMAWLCRLVTPPGGTILDPFAGTGTTGLAAMREGFDCILIEREAEYVADIHRRLAWARGEGRLTAQETARGAPEPVEGLPLFATQDTAA